MKKRQTDYKIEEMNYLSSQQHAYEKGIKQSENKTLKLEYWPVENIKEKHK
jgi:hypothetical protein